MGFFRKSLTSTGYFSNSNGSSVTRHQFSLFVGVKSVHLEALDKGIREGLLRVTLCKSLRALDP